MRIEFRVVPHSKQRYDTVGDWFGQRGALWIKVSDLKDKRYSNLVFLHELIEYIISRMHGIKAKDVDLFDEAYEAAREDGKAPCGCPIGPEPGDDEHAPYHRAHRCASDCEAIIASALDVDWAEYEKAIEAV